MKDHRSAALIMDDVVSGDSPPGPLPKEASDYVLRTYGSMPGPEVEPFQRFPDHPKKPRQFRIAFDIDGVMAASHNILSDVIKDKYGVVYPTWAAYSWEGHKALQHSTGVKITQSEYLHLFNLVWDRWEEILPCDVDINEKLFAQIQKMGHDVDLVTYSISEHQTRNKQRWIDSMGIESYNLLVNAKKTAGWKYEMPYDVFIEDCPHIAVGAYRVGKIAILYTQPWNLGVDTTYISHRIPNSRVIPFILQTEADDL